MAMGVIVPPFIELLSLEVGRYNSRALVAGSFRRMRGDSTDLGV
jgi:hypothetical protein